MASLPIVEVLGDVAAALRADGHVVLQAPPGAGKTTQVPLHLLRDGLIDGKIVMLEPRRIAARAAAVYIAGLLGETVGGRVGYRMRGETKVSAATRIEVVTEGVLTAMIQRAPDLPGIGCLIFDEFHERSIHADLGLALALEVREALRPDLKLVVMSATLDAEPIATLMGDAPVVTSDGRSFDVDTIWLDRPWRDPRGRTRFEGAMAGLIRRAVADQAGSVLAFLPGAGEIARVAAQLGDLPADCVVLPLYGALPFAAQTRALNPAPDGQRHVVLATAIAETSVTIPDIRVVVDGGLARRPRFDPATGLSRLVTERVARAEAVQRRGRAGRVAPGVCYRLWTKGEEGGMAAFAPVAILDDDLLGLALSLAQWGARDAGELRFLTPPPAATLTEARALLHDLDAFDAGGALTDHGRALAEAPLHPRLAHMLAHGKAMGEGPAAALLAVVLEARAQGPADLGEAARQATADDRRAAARLCRGVPGRDAPYGALLSLAFPDRIAQRRGPGDGRFLLANGRGAALRDAGAFGTAAYLVVADLNGAGRDATIRRAAVVAEEDLRDLHQARISHVVQCQWDKRQKQVVAQDQEMLGAIPLSTRPAEASPDDLAAAMVEGVRQIGLAALPWTRKARQLRDRAEWARARGADFADMSDAGLLVDLADWLGPHLTGMKRQSDLAGLDLDAALLDRLGWDAKRRLDAMMPARLTLPTGNTVAVDYSGAQPKISVRLQEMLGTSRHPTIGPDHAPVLIELLSPAHRPIQTTADLPAFWETSYGDVRKDMRGRYPRHVWPEDPAAAAPTARAKPRR